MAVVAEQLLFLYDICAALYIDIGLYNRDRLLCGFGDIAIGGEEAKSVADAECYSECGYTGIL